MTATALKFDSILLIAFGGPTSGDQGYDYVKGIVGDRPAAEDRIREVAGHYERLNGSPFNSLTFEQGEAISAELKKRGYDVPVYVGMRHWDPYVKDVMAEMVDDGREDTLAVIMAPHQCFVSWDWYQSTVKEANDAVGDKALNITYADPWWLEEGFITANAENIKKSLSKLGDKADDAKLIFSAHSIPVNGCPSCRAGDRTCPYGGQFEESAKATAAAVGRGDNYLTCYQSQSEFSRQWTEPDVSQVIKDCKEKGVRNVVVSPIGFLVDHVEVLWDLDVEAKETADECQIQYERAATAGTHPAFIKLMADRIVARFEDQPRIDAPLS